MYILEVSDPTADPEVFTILTVESVLDYVYMVEGEKLLPEYRMEYQHGAPNRQQIGAIRRGGFYIWRVGKDLPITYALSYTPNRKHGEHVKINHPVHSKYWGTVYGKVSL